MLQAMEFEPMTISLGPSGIGRKPLFHKSLSVMAPGLVACEIQMSLATRQSRPWTTHNVYIEPKSRALTGALQALTYKAPLADRSFVIPTLIFCYPRELLLFKVYLVSIITTKKADPSNFNEKSHLTKAGTVAQVSTSS